MYIKSKQNPTWGNRNISILDTTSRRLNNRLLQMAVGSPDKRDGQVACRRGHDRGELCAELKDWVLLDGLFAPQGGVHV